MAVIAVFATRWQAGVFLLDHDPYSSHGFIVTCRFGIYTETSRIQAVGHARDKFGPFWGMNGNEIATVDGKKIPESFNLQDGHELEFHRRRS